jgi:hypothetical protein
MSNNYVKIVLFENKHYWCDESDTQEMWILGRFLGDDVGCRKSGFKEWADKETTEYIGGNITDLERHGDYIILSETYVGPKNPGPFLKVPKQEFIRLLDEWEKICKEKPQEVLITFDGKCFTIETKQ